MSTLTSPAARNAPATDAAPVIETFEQAAHTVLDRLRAALADLLAAAPGETHRPTDVEKVFGIDYRLAWQVFKIATVDNPLAVAANVPARVSIRKLLQAATKRRIPRTVVDRVSSAFDGFEKLVETDAGDRETLESMLSAFIPEEREKAELANKEMAFKAMSQLKGVASEATHWAQFVSASSTPDRIEIGNITAYRGLRRSRPGAPITFSGADLAAPEPSSATIDGRNALESSPFLPQFSSSPFPSFNTWKTKSNIFHSVVDQDVGLRAAIDLAKATRYTGVISGAYRGLGWMPEAPTKRVTIDVFVQNDLWPGVFPELLIYDSARDGGVSRIHDPERQQDLLPLHETIRPLGEGFAHAKLTHLPRYIEMLEYCCRTLALDPRKFRGYRLDVQFPIYGAQYIMAFRLPDMPPSSQT